MTTILVTGATDGLGRAVAGDLAARGIDVLVHGRSAERAEAVAAEIGAAGVHIADFASLAGVRALADALPALDVLVSNAGLISSERLVTGDGLELTFQVNHLAPFLLTTRMLERAAPRRIVHVASAGQERPTSTTSSSSTATSSGARTAAASSRRSCSPSSAPAPARRGVDGPAPGDVHGHQDGPGDRRRPRTARCGRAPTRPCASRPSSTSTSGALLRRPARGAPGRRSRYDADAAQAALGRLGAAHGA